MKPRNYVYAICLSVGIAGALSAQTPLNNTPARDLGWPQLNVTNRNPNLVEGRELFQPESVAVDSSASPPILYVSDTSNNRVMAWKNATSFAPGTPADFIVGQKDGFTTNPQFNSVGLNSPTGVAVDAKGNLYVIDAGNNRILRFPKPAAQPGQPFPDMVIGQTSLNCSTCNLPNSGGLSASTVGLASNGTLFPSSIVFDAQGNLWLTDSGNNRVLRYNASVLPVTNPKSGPAADLVLGQVDFVSNAPPRTANYVTDAAAKTGMYNPSALAFDPSGRLYVTEAGGYSRVMVFQAGLNPPNFNGASALRLMGVFAQVAGSSAPPPQINNMLFAHPQGIFFVGTSPCIVDTGNCRSLVFPPYEQWPTDGTSPNASLSAVGQPTATTGKVNGGSPEPNAQSLSVPIGAVVTGGEVYVADAGNNRVLVFPASGLGTSSKATRLLGQIDFPFNAPNLIEGREMNFSSGSCGTSIFCIDGGVAVDQVSAVPHLYIADTYNNRVLGYFDSRTVQPGAKADLVIGQPDFNRAVVNYPSNDPTRPSAQSLLFPTDVAVDSSGNLYVADAGNGRVLRFPAPFNQTQPNVFESADLVLGQSDFNSQITDPTDRTMRFPYGLAFTSDGGLAVSDAGLNRILYFDGSQVGFTNGMPATLVLGQPDFNTSNTPPPQGTPADTNQFKSPRHIATDSSDRLYVADQGNNRVLIFDQTPFLTTNARAGTVLTGPTLASGFNGPLGIYVNPTTGEIWVSEAGVLRLSRFPSFDSLLFVQNQANTQISSNVGVALAQDAFGDLFVAEAANRIAVYYPGLSAVNAANNIPGRALAPGTIAIVQSSGNQFTVDAGASVPSGSPWVPALDDTQVLINNVPAPISAVSPSQITVVLPMGAPTSGTADVQVVRVSTGQVLGDSSVAMAPVSPGLFTVNGQGTGQLMAINDDGSVNQANNQVSRGGVIKLFGTGPGVIPGAPPDGQPATGQVPTKSTPNVGIGTAFVPAANIMYSGLAPNMVGMWEIDVMIPMTTVPGNQVEVLVQLNSITSAVAGQITTIAVK